MYTFTNVTYIHKPPIYICRPPHRPSHTFTNLQYTFANVTNIYSQTFTDLSIYCTIHIKYPIQ
uniref:Uncharacterized protein n=1 Tax=viral metagenome TaxID=1070528 RepID=A0A6C0BFL6_9ZZZZ